MHPTTRDAFTAWVAAAAIWFPMALAVYELLNFLSGHPFGLGIRNLFLFAVSGAVAAGFIAVGAGFIARQRLISDQTQRHHGD
jgi:hypothetical protein